MNIIAFTAAVLAVWRVTHLLVEEHGPWDVMARLRRGAAAVGLERLVNCFYCASVWIAVPFALLLTTRWRELVLVVPALSGGAILLERATQKEDAPPVWIEEQQKEKTP